jgi:hypothetical protein
MTARVLPFRRRHVTGLAIALEARTGWVVLTAHDLQLGFTPDQARELSRALAELADYVERGQP